MSKKVILFLSELKEGAKTAKYSCPDGSDVQGTQTNEAPVKYLINKYDDIDEIICITTKAADTALEHFKTSINEKNKNIKVTSIEHIENDNGELEDNDFEKDVIPQVMEIVGDSKAEILLETTGGFRNAIMKLLLLSRALSYAGSKTVDATYSDFRSKKVMSVLDLIEIFDLIAGMQELTLYGNVRVLRNYYENSKDEKILSLLNTTDELLQVITLCKTGQIKEKMDNFNKALKDAENSTDPIFNKLLPAFRNTFGKDKKLNLKSLIRWCTESNMIQQAVTIYTERIPEYIMVNNAKKKFAKIPDKLVEPKAYEDQYYADFYRGFLALSDTRGFLTSGETGVNEFREFCKNNAENIEKYCRYKNKDVIPEKYRAAVDNICIIAEHAYRGGRYNSRWVKEVEEIKPLLANDGFCTTDGNTRKNVEKFINHISCINEKLIYILLEKSDSVLNALNDKNNGEWEDTQIKTIENMSKLIKGSDYELKISVEEMQDICRDYLYIKTVRNMINHANDETTSKECKKYLKDKEYPDIDSVSTDELKEIIRRALKRL